MTLDEFIAETHREVDLFKEYYLAERKKAAKEHPEQDWPLVADEGAWYEQFIAWQQRKYE